MKSFIRRGAAIGLAVITAGATTATAATFQKVGTEAGWNVMVNEALGPGCLIEKKVDHLEVMLGIDASGSETIGYMAVYTRSDVDVAEGEAVPVSFQAGGRTFEGEAFGEKRDGFHGAWVPVNNREFIYDLAKEETMTVAVSDLPPIEVSLAGTEAAFQAMRTCQEQQ
jgi:hypothetical protein